MTYEAQSIKVSNKYILKNKVNPINEFFFQTSGEYNWLFSETHRS